MANQKVMRGLAPIAAALFLGVQSAASHMGSFARAGPGLLPLMPEESFGRAMPISRGGVAVVVLRDALQTP